jgi:hypothetical protein
MERSESSSDSSSCTWPPSSAASPASRFRFSGERSGTMSQSFVPRMTPHDPSAKPPMRTNRTSACTRRTSSSSKDGALTGSLCSIAQFEQLPCERDRLLEVQGKRSLSVCVQPHSSHSLALPVMELSLWHGPNATEPALRKLDRHNYLCD